MKYCKKLVGRRVYLSPMNPEDVPVYTRWMNDPAVTDSLGGTPRLVSLDSEAEWLENACKSGYQFAIVDLATDTLLGNCGIENLDLRSGTCEVGLFIGEAKHRGRGYGQEVLGLLTDFAFDTLRVHNVMLKLFSFNEPALACYTKAGFKEFGRRHEAYFLHGRWYDEIFMEMLETDRPGRVGQTDAFAPMKTGENGV